MGDVRVCSGLMAKGHRDLSYVRFVNSLITSPGAEDFKKIQKYSAASRYCSKRRTAIAFAYN
jgi:hypothetical protein